MPNFWRLLLGFRPVNQWQINHLTINGKDRLACFWYFWQMAWAKPFVRLVLLARHQQRQFVLDESSSDLQTKNRTSGVHKRPILFHLQNH